MLSLEASHATSLILARLNLLCRATELTMELEVLALLQSALGVSEGAHTGEDSHLSARSDAASSELAQLPTKVVALDERLGEAWSRLDRVSPRRRI